ncbi:MAG: helix-turn-helix transcriptional regulator, partial [Bacilli bacterium]|nr:helix-turn-helix transcriptional regulator [Bacilli bacterium]
MDKIKMGDFLQSLRNEKDLTQTDVAEIFTVTPQAVSKWESGQSIPDVEMLE